MDNRKAGTDAIGIDLPSGERSQFTADPLNSFTLPSRYYTDPAIL